MSMDSPSLQLCVFLSVAQICSFAKQLIVSSHDYVWLGDQRDNLAGVPLHFFFFFSRFVFSTHLIC